MSQYPDYYSCKPYPDLFIGTPPNSQELNSRTSAPNPSTTYCHTSNRNAVERHMDDALAKLEIEVNEMKNSLMNFLSQYRLQVEKMATLEELLEKVLERIPEKEQDIPLDYTFVPYDKVMELYNAFSTNPRAFVRALEIYTYQDQVYELRTAASKRIFTADRVNFIKKCLFRHFSVPRNLQEDVWRSARTSLNGRSGRLRRMIRAKQISGFRTSTPVSDLLEGLVHSDGPAGEVV